MSDIFNEFDALLDAPDTKRVDYKAGKWKEAGSRIMWLSAVHAPAQIHTHTFPVRSVNRDTGDVRYWGKNYLCFEDEKARTSRFKLGFDDEGRRNFPAAKCPFCRLDDMLRDLLAEREISWTDVLFDFDDGEESRTIHVGGYLNLFGRRDLTEVQKQQIKKAKIQISSAWEQNAQVKTRAIFAHVDDADPSALHWTEEPGLLFEKYKEAVRKAIKDVGSDKGRPWVNPYPFEFEYKKNEPQFDKKYDITAFPSKADTITDQIADLIKTPDPDGLARMRRMARASDIRELMEMGLRIEAVSLDEIFKPLAGAQAEDDVSASELESPKDAPAAKRGARVQAPAESAPEAPTKAATAKPGGRGTLKTPKEEAPAPKVESKPVVDMAPCDACGKEFPTTESKCPHCGAEYNVENDDEIPF